MTMTPEERAVVQAAIEDHRGCAPETCGGSRLDPCKLANAIDALIYSCPDCNRGGHTCPGDGKSIGHGDIDCGEHDDISSPEDDGALRAELADTAGANEPIWVPATWADVRTGDDVRLPGTENYAHVQRAVHLHWHVDPRSSEYRPQPLEWSGVAVTLYTAASDGTRGMASQASEFTMDPAKPIEIKTTQLELDAVNLLGGWPARIGIVTDAQ